MADDVGMCCEGTVGNDRTDLGAAGATHDSDRGAHGVADDSNAGAGNALLSIVKGGQKVADLAIGESDGRATARAVAVVVEEEHVETGAPQGCRNTDKLGLGAAIAGAADDDAIRFRSDEPPAMDSVGAVPRGNSTSSCSAPVSKGVMT